MSQDVSAAAPKVIRHPLHHDGAAVKSVLGYRMRDAADVVESTKTA